MQPQHHHGEVVSNYIARIQPDIEGSDVIIGTFLQTNHPKWFPTNTKVTTDFSLQLSIIKSVLPSCRIMQDTNTLLQLLSLVVNLHPNLTYDDWNIYCGVTEHELRKAKGLVSY